MPNPDQPSSADEIRITCPQCGGPSSFVKANAWRPFCSERCKLIDLGAWGNEDFRIGSSTPPDLGEDGAD
ncbi:MAG: DNA gyrase inhibitor YacG [Comamonas sp.]